jgi:hypothetical protein
MFFKWRFAGIKLNNTTSGFKRCLTKIITVKTLAGTACFPLIAMLITGMSGKTQEEKNYLFIHS